jgi:AAHS family 4-hydroxybenzoate transporter-like MFS transporter
MATSVNELTILRFLAGIGLGGMLPNLTALNVEFAPRRVRATLVVLMFLGVTAGAALPAVVVALPSYGWRGLYFIGGVVPLIMTIALLLWLPELIKFLSLRNDARARARLEKLVRKLRPDLTITPDTVFVSSEERRKTKVPVADLFQDGLQWITPLLWLLFIGNLPPTTSFIVGCPFSRASRGHHRRRCDQFPAAVDAFRDWRWR